MNMTKYIKIHIGEKELYNQLDEECKELAMAALKLGMASDKLRRSRSIVNKPRMSEEEAMNNFIEEIADVLNCLEIIGLNEDQLEEIDNIKIQKRWRWFKQIKERVEGGSNG